MPLSLFQEAVFLGRSPAGLLSAALAAKLGLRVLWQGSGEPEPFFASEGLRYPAMPRWLPPYGESPLADALLRELALEDPVHRLGEETPGHFQLITPDQRIDLFSDRQRLARELERARIPDAGSFMEWLERADRNKNIQDELLTQAAEQAAGGRLAWAGLKRRLRSLEVGAATNLPWLARVLKEATEFFAYLPGAQLRGWAVERWARFILGGMRPVVGLEEALLGVMEKSGARLEPGAVSESISRPGRREFLLQSADSVRSRSLVLGLSLARAAELVDFGKLRLKLQALSANCRQLAGLFSVHLILPAQALPVGMSSRLLIIPNVAEQPAAENLVLANCRFLSEKPEKVCLQLFCRIGIEKRSQGRAVLAPLQQQLLAALSLVVPFLREAIESVASPFWSGRASDEPHPEPWGLHPLFEIADPLPFGLNESFWRDPPPGLVPAGPELAPLMGFEGAVLAARAIVRRLERLLQRRLLPAAK